MLQSMGSQRVRHDLAAEQQQYSRHHGLSCVTTKNLDAIS